MGTSEMSNAIWANQPAFKVSKPFSYGSLNSDALTFTVNILAQVDCQKAQPPLLCRQRPSASDYYFQLGF